MLGANLSRVTRSKEMVSACGWFVVVIGFLVSPVAKAGFWAASVIAFDSGSGAHPSYPDPAAALGPIDGTTGEGSTFPGPVTLFNPPFNEDELVSIGIGGSITLQFVRSFKNRPGPDFIVYGNAGFIDVDWPNGTLGSPVGLFGDDGVGSRIEVSLDGIEFLTVAGLADSLFPTQPWRDVGSTRAAHFHRPIQAGLILADFDGLTFLQALSLYDGSAGGAAFDIDATGLNAFQYVRVTNVDGGGDGNLEIDALAVIPEPSTWLLLLLGAVQPYGFHRESRVYPCTVR